MIISESNKQNYFLIFFFVFITFTAATSLNPILPTFLLSVYDKATVPYLYGLIVASFLMGQFISVYFLPYFARKYSYHKVILITSMGSLITTFFMSMALVMHYFYLAIFFRLLSGCLEANVVLAREVIINVIPEKIKRQQQLGLISTAITLGFLAGPITNGWFYTYQPTLALFFPSILSIMLIFIAFQLTKIKMPPFKPKEIILGQNRISMKQLLIFGFTIYFAADLFYQYIPLYLTMSFSLSVSDIAINLFLIALGNALVSPFAYLPGQYWGYKQALIIFSCFFIMNLFSLTFATGFFVSLLLFMQGSFIAILSNNLIFYFTETHGHRSNYLLSHLFSTRIMVSALSALLAGQIALQNIQLPFYLSICFLILFLFSIRFVWTN